MGKFEIGAFAKNVMETTGDAPKDIEAITSEILTLKEKAGTAILDIGRRLIDAKALLPHGEWLPWLTERVEFSERSAQNFMRLAREWSNPQALADLGATKALTLLALPREERERFLEEHNVIDMSARQLETAIRERDEALKAAQAAKADAATAEEARAKMAEDMRLLNVRLEGSREDRDQAMRDVARLEAELEELKARPVDVAVETVVDQEAVEKARADAVAEMKGRLDRAKAAKAKAEERQKAAEDSLAEVRQRLEAAEKADKRAALSADKDLAMFEVLFTQGQELANKLHGLLIKARGREDQTAAQGMEKALRALAEAIGRCAE